MIRTTVTAVLITALFTAICCAAGLYNGRDAIVFAIALSVVLTAIVQRHMRRNSVRSTHTRTKPAAQPRWLATVLACVALAAPTVAWSVGTVVHWMRDQVWDADRS